MRFRPSAAEQTYLDGLRNLRPKLTDSAVLTAAFSFAATVHPTPDQFLGMLDAHEARIKIYEIKEEARRRVVQLEEQLEAARADLARKQTLHASTI